MFAALAIRVNIDNESLDDKRVFDVALVILQFVAPLAVLVVTVGARIGGCRVGQQKNPRNIVVEMTARGPAAVSPEEALKEDGVIVVQERRVANL